MSTEALFTAALGLQSPWKVADIQFDEAAKRIDFDVIYASGSRFDCPACGAGAQGVHDTRKRSWQHLHFFEHRAFIHADVPRVRCGQCRKTTQVKVPWARPGSGFSQLFEALVVALSSHMPANTVARFLGIGDDSVWRILHHYVDEARDQEDHSAVTAVGIDETAARRGHDYITLVHDLHARKVLFACPGRDKSAIAAFVEDLRAHGGDPDRVTAACIDMSKAYIAGVTESLPQAAITFDRFHVAQLANKAVDAVRRQEVRWQPLLRRTRWLWLKDPVKLTPKEQRRFRSLSAQNMDTARAWKLKQTLADVLASGNDRATASGLLDKWYSWARRCRLQPFKDLALTIREHRDGILNARDSKLSNGVVEGMNGLIQAAKARARGYRTHRNLITMSYLIGARLKALPANPYDTRCGVAVP